MSTFSAGARRPSSGTGSGSTRPFVRAGGPPWLQLRRPDAQHGLFGYSGMLAALTAIYAASRAVGLVRIAANDTTAIGRARGAGAAWCDRATDQHGGRRSGRPVSAVPSDGATGWVDCSTSISSSHDVCGVSGTHTPGHVGRCGPSAHPATTAAAHMTALTRPSG